ncbi:MAG: tautomerase family protein [Nibricoccus sp.]
MPVISIEAPAGLSEPKKQEMMRRLHAAVEEAYGLGNTLTFLREYPRQNVAIDGIQPSGKTGDMTTSKRNHATT